MKELVAATAVADIAAAVSSSNSRCTSTIHKEQIRCFGDDKYHVHSLAQGGSRAIAGLINEWH